MVHEGKCLSHCHSKNRLGGRECRCDPKESQQAFKYKCLCILAKGSINRQCISRFTSCIFHHDSWGWKRLNDSQLGLLVSPGSAKIKLTWLKSMKISQLVQIVQLQIWETLKTVLYLLSSTMQRWMETQLVRKIVTKWGKKTVEARLTYQACE